MTTLTHLAFIGNHPPRRCGIATFTHDLNQAVCAARPVIETTVVTMTDQGRVYDFPPAVQFRVRDDVVEDYRKAADFLNKSSCEAVSLQHEFGIFGGEAGGHLSTLLTRLKIPIVTTLHTVLASPTPAQRDVMGRIIQYSAKLVVMSQKGREILRSTYDVPANRIEVIPHGIPDVPFAETQNAKVKFGFEDKTVILTFGLLSPNKGIEVMINAMPLILESCPNAIYIVLGATHPNLVLSQGEAYREKLMARVRELGVDASVVFFNQFVDQATLFDFIAMCDVYVTPYLNEAQMTSGTLSYSFGAGKAVVSTPYWHAKELLADGKGILVPFGDAKAIGAEIAGLLTNDVRRHAMRKRAYAFSRDMTWKQTADRYLSVFDDVLTSRVELLPKSFRQHETPDFGALPAMQMSHFLSMCDGTGLLQHAIYSVPDRAHGYCLDDNARALILSCALEATDRHVLPEELTARFAAFVQHAWNPDKRRFRNFMSYERCWLEESGSEDSHGRALWALGECALHDSNRARRNWAAPLFEQALPAVEGFRSPRAWAFALLGLDAFCARDRRSVRSESIRTLLSERLMSALAAVTTTDWVWFEDELAYDNARLPQALIATGIATATPSYVEAGTKALRWLTGVQTSAAGFFRPVGTEGFGLSRQPPKRFDQQPIEAAATISACFAAFRATRKEEWTGEAMRAFRWFLGDNDLGVALAEPETGACADGLHCDRPNENQGAESVLAYLLGLAEIREYAHSNETTYAGLQPKLALSA